MRARMGAMAAEARGDPAGPGRGSGAAAGSAGAGPWGGCGGTAGGRCGMPGPRGCRCRGGPRVLGEACGDAGAGEGCPGP